MTDATVKDICQAWAQAGYGDECFWEHWAECPTEETLTPNMVLACISAQAAEIERLREALQWCSGSADFNEGGIAREGWLKLCAPLLTGSATVKDSLTTEDEKQSHEWKCPIDYPGCRKNCGGYICKN